MNWLKKIARQAALDYILKSIREEFDETKTFDLISKTQSN